MATAPTSNVVRPLDPFKTARIPVRMSARVTPSSHHEGGSFSAVKFNHKPSQVSVTRKTRLRTSIDECRLVINDYDQGSQQPNASYEYKGVKRSTSNMYALIVSEDRQSLILEPVDSEYLFNLTTAPWEKDSSKLASAYPQLELAMHDKAENTGGEKRDSHEGDGAFNPFDYRHYLEPSPPSSPEVAQRSVVASPFGFPDASPQHLRVRVRVLPFRLLEHRSIDLRLQHRNHDEHNSPSFSINLRGQRRSNGWIKPWAGHH